MSIKEIFNSSNRTAVYIIVALVVVIVIMILGGSDWLRDIRVSQSLGVSSWRWNQIIISLAIGFGLGWLVFRKS